MIATLTWPLRIVWFVVWFLGQQIHATTVVVGYAVRPHSSITPGFLIYRTRCRTDFEITLLSILITLTPGTLTLRTHRPEGGPEWELLVHGMHPSTPVDMTASLRDMEDHMLAAVRRKGVTG